MKKQKYFIIVRSNSQGIYDFYTIKNNNIFTSVITDAKFYTHIEDARYDSNLINRVSNYNTQVRELTQDNNL